MRIWVGQRAIATIVIDVQGKGAGDTVRGNMHVTQDRQKRCLTSLVNRKKTLTRSCQIRITSPCNGHPEARRFRPRAESSICCGTCGLSRLCAVKENFFMTEAQAPIVSSKRSNQVAMPQQAGVRRNRADARCLLTTVRSALRLDVPACDKRFEHFAIGSLEAGQAWSPHRADR